MSLRLNVLDAAASSLKRLVFESPKWLSVMFLPWLLGSVIYTYAAFAVPRAFQLGFLPSWIGSAIFLPFSALIVSAVLGNILHRTPCGFRSLKVTQDTGRIALVLVSLFLAHLLIDAVKDQVINIYIQYQNTNRSVFVVEEALHFSAVLTGLIWMLTCLAIALIYPMAPIVVERRQFDFKRWFALVRAHGWRFFLLAVLLSAAYKGFEKAYTAVLPWTITLPIAGGSGSMREFLILQFLQLLVYLPADFVAELLPPVAAGTVYVALLARSGSDS